MALYIAQRLALSVAIVAIALALLFGMIHLVPGDPASIALGPRATPELIQEFRQRMGLDRPVVVQFALFLLNVLRGDLGRDVFTNQPVLQIILNDLRRASRSPAPGSAGRCCSACRWAASRRSGATPGSTASPASCQ